MRRWIPTLAAVVCACLGLAAGQAAAVETKLNVTEDCSFALLPDDGVVLTTTFTVTNARHGRAASVRIVAGWNVGRRYFKAAAPTLVRVGPGRSARRVVKRALLDSPALWQTLRDADRFTCASTKAYTIG